MSCYRAQIAAALRAVSIHGTTRYAWLDRLSRPLPASIADELDEPARRRYLVSCLREELYSSFYRHGEPVPARWGEPDPGFADPDLIDAMSAANRGRGGWSPGWRVVRLDGDEALLTKAGLRARTSVGDCCADGGAVAAGMPVSVRLPKELPAQSPGFYTVLGDATPDGSWASGMVRVYWNISCVGAPALVRELTTQLNRSDVPFRLKVADHPFRFERCDAAVLYLGDEAFGQFRAALCEIACRLRAHLRPEIPAFTLRLVAGVGLAEDGGDGGPSFGERRCAALADGIVRAHELGEVRAAARLDAVSDRFAEDGVDVEAPYLEPSHAGRHVL